MSDESLPTMRDLMAAQDRMMQKRRESTDPAIVAQMADYDAAMAANVQRLADHIDAAVVAEIRATLGDKPATDDQLRASALRMLTKHRASLEKLAKEPEC